MPRLLRCLAPLAGFALIFSAACDEKKPPEPAKPAPVVVPPPPPTAARPAAPDPAAPAAATPVGKGTIKGVVTLKGKPPEMPELKRATDPFCAKTKMKDEEVIVKDGKLVNVLVHVNGAPPADPPATPVEVDQKDCMYRPRVAGVVAGQTVKITNSDDTLHNVHTYKGTSTLFNVAQVPHAPHMEKKFTDNGALLKLKCDVHQWMTGYIWVQNNPYFAVTGDKGSFEIKDVPAGKYEIEAWHERFGTQKVEVTVEPDKTAELKLELSADAPNQGSK
jgi:plastocyanin